MPNMQIPIVGLTPTQIVACAIKCCDEKKYDYKNPRPADKTCQRIGSRKHSCVLHHLREKKGDKITTKNRSSKVMANPPVRTIRGKRCIPDTIVKKGDDWHVIDAKFPCDTDEANDEIGLTKNKKKTRRATGVVYKSPSRGKSMATAKEKTLYKQYRVGGKRVKSVSCMTPAQAAKKLKKGQCKCN